MNFASAVGEANAIKAMSYEELEIQFTPLMFRMARQFIPGYDFEDRMQECRIVLARSQQLYDPASRERPQYAGFLSYLMTALTNRLNNLRTRQRRHFAPGPGLDTAQAKADGHSKRTGHINISVVDGLASCQECRWRGRELRAYTIMDGDALDNVALDSFEDEAVLRSDLMGLSPEAKAALREAALLPASRRMPKLGAALKQEIRSAVSWRE